MLKQVDEQNPSPCDYGRELINESKKFSYKLHDSFTLDKLIVRKKVRTT